MYPELWSCLRFHSYACREAAKTLWPMAINGTCERWMRVNSFFRRLLTIWQEVFDLLRMEDRPGASKRFIHFQGCSQAIQNRPAESGGHNFK